MYAAVRRYEGVSYEADELDDAMRRVALSLSDSRGFVSFLALEAEAGVLLTVGIFETPEALEAATAREEAAPSLSSPGPLSLSQETTGEIVFQKGL